MSRRIYTEVLQAGGAGPSQQPDTYTDRIVKFIPTDVVAGWLAVTSAIKAAAQPPNERILWVIFAFGALCAAAWTWRQTKLPGKPPYIQVAISTGAFFVWAYATGGGVPQWPGTIYQPLYATLLLVGFSLLSGLITKA